MKKIDFKKELKELYKASSKEVQIVKVPRLNYLMIDGTGDPNTSQEYKDAVEALFSLSYTVKFMIKKGSMGIDYGVMPLQGLWYHDNMELFSQERKEEWKWTSLIMQPEFVSKEIIEEGIEQVKKKKDLPGISKIRFESLDEGLVAQIIHIGPYSEEMPTIEKLHNFIEENGYIKVGNHHEIYLSDPRKAAPQNLKTIIRQPISLKK
ncbi:GyrI-like domain-containing protein [Oceanirhabdus sp. W0125-5]|uniref:GyrI-like domain-containing protein n=1 Tax=Oceanirhabdus sp. W0125-5 TaxID=2999116 RepID=UPI0022F2D813|nr:GyrI-like domain-containing protein [Oceanirhabdus sp. W0125-5]WBW96366.1 GyrI-like domain-containing protein [Oceanirhabdus sp. W0125-5]